MMGDYLPIYLFLKEMEPADGQTQSTEISPKHRPRGWQKNKESENLVPILNDVTHKLLDRVRDRTSVPAAAKRAYRGIKKSRSLADSPGLYHLLSPEIDNTNGETDLEDDRGWDNANEQNALQ